MLLEVSDGESDNLGVRVELDSRNHASDVLDDARVSLVVPSGDGDLAVDPAVRTHVRSGVDDGSGSSEAFGVEALSDLLGALGSVGDELASANDEDSAVLDEVTVVEEGVDTSMDVEDSSPATVDTLLAYVRQYTGQWGNGRGRGRTPAATSFIESFGEMLYPSWSTATAKRESTLIPI